MTNREAIDRIECHMIEPHSLYITEALNMAIEALAKDNNNVPNKNGWISVKDRLPNKEDEYLVVYSKNCINFAWYDKSNTWIMDGSQCGEGYVTHWMTLPEPPEEE